MDVDFSKERVIVVISDNEQIEIGCIPGRKRVALSLYDHGKNSIRILAWFNSFEDAEVLADAMDRSIGSS